jgi:hypothetical protein
MAGPVVTALLSPNPASGIWAPTDNTTETTLASATAASGTFILLLDTSTQADGDQIQLRAYASADGTNSRVLDELSLGPAAPSFKMVSYGPFATADFIKFTALLVAGSTTSRSFAWRVVNLNGA